MIEIELKKISQIPDLLREINFGKADLTVSLKPRWSNGFKIIAVIGRSEQ